MLTACRHFPPSPSTSPQILSLQWHENGKAQLVSISTTGKNLQPVTPIEWDVLDYAISANGNNILVTELMPENAGSKLWQVNNGKLTQLLECLDKYCTHPLWQPDGSGFIYETWGLDAGIYNNNPPQLWWYDLAQKTTTPITLTDEKSGYGKQFSPDGNWFSYAAPLDHALQLFDLGRDEKTVLHVHTDHTISWQPNSLAFIAIHNQFDGRRFSTQLAFVDVTNGETENYSGEGNYEDGPAAWSLDGKTIAFGRKIPGTGMGKQIWLLKADGTELQQLTNDAEIHHAGIQWSANSQYLLYQKSNITQLDNQPSIWIYSFSTGKHQLLLSSASAPQWYSSYDK